MSRPAILRRGCVEGARAGYVLNSSEIRGLARYPGAGKTREQALEEVCKARAFWHGDRWSQPASEGARAALKVLEARRYGVADPLASLAMLRAWIKPHQFAAYIQCRRAISAYHNAKRAPLPDAKAAKQ